MNEEMSDLPQAETADPDGVQVALRAAQTLWSRGETSESLKWLRKAAESASDEGADVRSLQLAKAAAELRAKLFGGNEVRANAGEISGAHPIADSLAARGTGRLDAGRLDAESGASRSSSFPPAPGDAAGSGEHAGSHSSRPVTATQYPSHRPRQRIGLTSVPGTPVPPRDTTYVSRESAAYAAVPSWSADSERRVSAAPPPLPLSALDDYEELEAEPDEEPADDPASVWSQGGDSWRAPERSHELSGEASATPLSGMPVSMLAGVGAGTGASASSGAASSASSLSSSALPPPLPPRGAFADDDADFGLLADPPTVVIPPPEGADTHGSLAARWTAASEVFDRESRASGWERESSWAAELRSTSWSSGESTAPGPLSNSSAGVGLAVPNLGAPSFEPGTEPPPPSDTAPAKLTARVHHQAVRVSFAADLRVPGQYVVRPLREGEKAAAGERIALLVALEPGVPLV